MSRIFLYVFVINPFYNFFNLITFLIEKIKVPTLGRHLYDYSNSFVLATSLIHAADFFSLRL